MLERIDNSTAKKDYEVLEFEYYDNLSENYFVVMSYFKNANNNNLTMCQWHVATMSEDGSTFTILQRIGSCAIEHEDLTIPWKETGAKYIATL
jgi:hypothetical protein